MPHDEVIRAERAELRVGDEMPGGILYQRVSENRIRVHRQHQIIIIKKREITVQRQVQGTGFPAADLPDVIDTHAGG